MRTKWGLVCVRGNGWGWGWMKKLLFGSCVAKWHYSLTTLLALMTLFYIVVITISLGAEIDMYHLSYICTLQASCWKLWLRFCGPLRQKFDLYRPKWRATGKDSVKWNTLSLYGYFFPALVLQHFKIMSLILSWANLVVGQN